MKNTYVIGLMSGTSLDGVDIALCRFTNNPIEFDLIKAHTFPYPCGFKSKLEEAINLNGAELNKLHIELGELYGNMIISFIKTFSISKVDLIASHGHTIFHEPDKKITLQIGHPAYIAIRSGIPTVGDFRSADVFLDGQGAPLVPIGDKNLFSEYNNRVNLGGFANISYEKDNKTIAFDICPANIPLNLLAQEMGYSYDDEGSIAASGQIDKYLLDELSSLKYFSFPPPKSLGREWFDNEFLPIINKSESSIVNKIRTVTELIAMLVSSSLLDGNTIITGGGANNKFLIKRIKSISKNKIIIPSENIVNFKEAIIFAYLGFLRINNMPNTLSSVTGASKNHISGGLYLP